MIRLALATFTMLLVIGRVIAADTLPPGVTIGDKAPDFSARNVDGKTVSLASFRNAKGVIIVFMANHCPFSTAYEDRIIALHKKYAPEGWPVLGISSSDATEEPEDSFEKMKARATEKEYPFPYVYDSTQAIAHAYGARRTPHVFLLHNTKTGFVVEYIGAVDDNPRDAEAVEQKFVENAVADLTHGTTPRQAITKAIGCTIIWKEQ